MGRLDRQSDDRLLGRGVVPAPRVGPAGRLDAPSEPPAVARWMGAGLMGGAWFGRRLPFLSARSPAPRHVERSRREAAGRDGRPPRTVLDLLPAQHRTRTSAVLPGGGDLTRVR